jgi:hypothetical protein
VGGAAAEVECQQPTGNYFEMRGNAPLKEQARKLINNISADFSIRSLLAVSSDSIAFGPL